MAPPLDLFLIRHDGLVLCIDCHLHNIAFVGLSVIALDCAAIFGAGLQTRGDQRRIELRDGRLTSTFNGVLIGSAYPIETIQAIDVRPDGRRYALVLETDAQAIEPLAGHFREENARYIAWLLRQALFQADFVAQHLQVEQDMLLDDVLIAQQQMQAQSVSEHQGRE